MKVSRPARPRWLGRIAAGATAACVALALALGAHVVEAQGVAVEGVDQARLLPPAGASVAAYENAGYRLWLENGEARIEVRATPLGSEARFELPAVEKGELTPIERLARAQTLGSKTQFEASARILDWVARHIAYRLDRGEDQAADAVLERRAGFCTGIARLTVALMRAVGLEAREVAGYVLGDEGFGEPQGYHRWVETRLADVGWVFSDPLSTHHFVPANYMRLDSKWLRLDEGVKGLLLERQDALTTVDLYPLGTAGVRARRNTDRQIAASVHVRVDSHVGGIALLETTTRRWRHALVSGEATFVGLPAGDYQLRLMVAGAMLERSLSLGGRERTTLFLALPSPDVTRLETLGRVEGADDGGAASGALGSAPTTHSRWSFR
ncbi:MAG: transglutaminase-like domain-containing protein [Acidobacteriota bacterium]